MEQYLHHRWSKSIRILLPDTVFLQGSVVLAVKNETSYISTSWSWTTSLPPKYRSSIAGESARKAAWGNEEPLVLGAWLRPQSPAAGAAAAEGGAQWRGTAVLQLRGEVRKELLTLASQKKKNSFCFVLFFFPSKGSSGFPEWQVNRREHDFNLLSESTQPSFA